MHACVIRLVLQENIFSWLIYVQNIKFVYQDHTILLWPFVCYVAENTISVSEKNTDLVKRIAQTPQFCHFATSEKRSVSCKTVDELISMFNGLHLLAKTARAFRLNEVGL